MKNKISIISVFLLVFCFVFSSCSDDNSEPPCLETNVSMVINGELQNFYVLGRGIDLRQNGYELSLSFDRRNNEIPLREQGISIVLPYKKTGANLIESFYYHQYFDGVSFDGDFIDGEFESEVFVNRNTCFYATFSGKLNNGNQEIVITDGIISVEYDPPFENEIEIEWD